MTHLKLHEVVSVICLIAAVSQHADAQDRLVLTGDNRIKKVCTAGGGQDLTSSLRYAKKINKIDHIAVPFDANCINIEGYNIKHTWPGIAAYIRGATALLPWKCQVLKRVTNKNCCGITELSKDWKKKRGLLKYGIDKHHKKQFKWKLHGRAKYWYWAKQMKRTKACCQICKCAAFCKTCSTSGSCDVCYGATCTNSAGAQVCEAKCDIDIRSSGTDVAASERVGYIKVTHTITGVENVYKPTRGDGFYAYKFDTGSCALYDMYFNTDENLVQAEINTWNLGTDNENTVAVYYAYARTTATAAVDIPDEPFIKLSFLPGSGGTPSVPPAGANVATKYKNTITGCPGGDYSTYTFPLPPAAEIDLF